MKKPIIFAIIFAFLLAESSAYPQTKDFFELVQTGTPEDVQAAITNGAAVNAKDDDGATPLLYAAMKNQNPEVISTLLNAGASVNARTIEGWTPLMAAALGNQTNEVITCRGPRSGYGIRPGLPN